MLPSPPASNTPDANLGDGWTFGARHAWCLLGATLVAAAVRFLHLGDWSLWVDEAHTWRDATMPLRGENGFFASDRAWYPVTFLLLRALLDLQWLGSDEWSLRLPFAVVGIATVPLLGACGRTIVGSWPAVFAAWLLALNPWHVYWSQNARGYVFVVFAAVIVVDRTRAYASGWRWRDLLLAIAAMIFAVASHATGALLAVGFGAFFVLRRIGTLGRPTLLRLLVGAVVLAFVLPWLIHEYAPFRGFLQAKDEPSLGHFVQTTAYYFRPTALVAAAIGMLVAWRACGRERALLLGAFAVVPFFVLLAVSGQLVKTTARYAICTLPVVTWLAALAAMQAAALLQKTGAARRVLWAAGAVVPLLLVADHCQHLFAYHDLQHGQRPPWRQAVRFVHDAAGRRPLRVLTVNHPTLLYYLRPGHWQYAVPQAHADNEVMPLIRWMIDAGVDEGRERVHAPGPAAHLAWHLTEAHAAGALFAVVVTMPELVEQDRDGGLRRELATDFTLALHLPCWVGPKDESIYVFLPRQP